MNVGPHPSCRTCAHKLVDSINDKIRQGIPVEEIAREYKLSRSGLFRHRKSHVGPAIAPDGRRTRSLRKVNGLAPLERLEKLLATLNATLDSAIKRGRQPIVLQCAREIRATMESLASARKNAEDPTQQAGHYARCLAYAISLLPPDVRKALACDGLPKEACSYKPFDPSQYGATSESWECLREALRRYEAGEEYAYKKPKWNPTTCSYDAQALN